MRVRPNGLFGPVNRILAPIVMSVKLDSPYNRLMNGASVKYAGATVNVSGSINGLSVGFAGIVLVASTIPGNILPAGDPIPGKCDADPKFPPPPTGAPTTLTKGGAITLPVKPRLGPVAPINGNGLN